MKTTTLKGAFLVSSLIFGGLSFSQTARVQIVHNSADLGAAVVDVYAGSALLIDNFEFRTATAFLDLPAGVPINVGIAPSTSMSSAESIATIPVTFTDGETYIVVANGLISPSGYSPDAIARPFNLYATALGREEASTTGNTDVLVFHGATDAPTVDVQAVGAGTIINDISWSEYDSDYLELPTADYTLNVTDASGMTVVKSYQAPLATLGLEDSALVVLASGFLDPSMNSGGEEFGLWVALPEGGDLIPLPESNARLQVIHNSADLAAETVDIYYDGNLLIDDFKFRTSSAYIDVTAEVGHEIAVAPGTSTDVSDALVTIPLVFEANKTYVAIANGIISPSGYSPSTPFSLDVFDMGQENATLATNTDVLVFHGSTDAPVVDINEASAGNLVDNAAYGDFAGYLNLATANYIIQVRNEAGTDVLFSYSAPLGTLMLENLGIVVVASGFVDPSVNSDGESFGLWVALPSGGDLVELPTAYASISENEKTLALYPNPTNDNFRVSGIENVANISILSIEGKTLYTKTVQAGESIDVNDLASGIYLVKINEGKNEQIVKLTIK